VKIEWQQQSVKEQRSGFAGRVAIKLKQKYALSY
jgi:hypothetical protein